MKIKSIKKLEEVYDRYDLTVGETSNFFANGVLIHNTSAIYSNILTKKPFNPFRKFFNTPSMEYKFVYSSRSIVKNRKDGKYTDDVWGIHAQELDGAIPPGFSVYAELVGYTSGGKMIQKGYDYGVNPNDSECWVYRVTYTNADGTKKELSFGEIEEFCLEHGLKTVPVYYSGKAKDLFPGIPIDENWNNAFLSELKAEFLDKPCEFCTTGVVREGIVLKIDSRESKPVFKFKSPLFEIKSSSERDNGEVDMEEES